MKKCFHRFIMFILLAATFLSTTFICTAANYQKPKLVVDNDIPYIYNPASKYCTYDFFRYADHFCKNKFPLSRFAQYFNTGVIRHFRAENKDLYYTVYSLENSRLSYLFLKPSESGDFLIDEKNGHMFYDITCDTQYIKPLVFDYDLPQNILGDLLPNENKLSTYSEKEIAKKELMNQKMFDDYVNYTGLEKAEVLKNADGVKEFYRCLRHQSFDIINKETNFAWHGVYVYDLSFFEDRTARIEFRHFRQEEYTSFVQDSSVTKDLSVQEAKSLSDVIEKQDFWNIPEWNPEEHDGCDGETTYLMGMDSNGNSHFISMWESWERYGIYNIRTALEDMVVKGSS